MSMACNNHHPNPDIINEDEDFNKTPKIEECEKRCEVGRMEDERRMMI